MHATYAFIRESSYKSNLSTGSWPYILYSQSIYYISVLRYLKVPYLWCCHGDSLSSVRAKSHHQTCDPSQWPAFPSHEQCSFTVIPVCCVRGPFKIWHLRKSCQKSPFMKNQTTKMESYPPFFNFYAWKRWSSQVTDSGVSNKQPSTTFLIDDQSNVKINSVLLKRPYVLRYAFSKPQIWYFTNSMKASPGWWMEVTHKHACPT